MKLDRLSGGVPAQFRSEPQCPVDARCDSGSQDITSIHHDTLIDRNGTEERQ
jgi:hypothetical protein